MPDPIQLRLDSSHPQPSRWHCPSSRARLLLRCDSRTHVAELRNGEKLVQQWNDPLAALNWMEQSIRDSGIGAPAIGAAAPARWIGYLSYDLGRYFESLPARSPDDLNLPLFAFARILPSQPEINSSRPCFPPTTGDQKQGRELFFVPAAAGIKNRDGSCFLSRSNFTKSRYLETVERVIAYIRAGDVFQVNLSQRFSFPLAHDPGDIYARLLRDAPAWYGAYLDFGDHVLICNSPELFLRVMPDAKTGVRRILTRPIKGTRPRLSGMEAELRASPKDQAELNMIVDLERNDLGRVCEIGSVKVAQPRVIETHPTVFHGSASIEGILRGNVSFVDLLRATFPGGSVTGAPKIRAMQIIEELEPVRRGPYCGAIGYLSSDGTIEFNVAIRTMIAKDGQVYVPVGGGIVADSNPQAEYEETLVKAEALVRALGPA